MTVGNVTRDPRQISQVWSPFTPGYVSVYTGTRTSKNWSGQDWPKTKPVRPVPEERSPGLGALSRPPVRARREEHTYSCVGSAETTGLCIAHSRSSPTMYRVSSGWAGVSNTFLVFPANEHIALLEKLRSQIAGSSFNAGVTLAEGKESLRMISQSATKVYHSLRLLKRGRWGEARHALTGEGSLRRTKAYDHPDWIDDVAFNKRDARLRQYDRDLSANWLELQYGWLPLLKDVKEASEFLAHKYSAPLQQRYVVRRRISTRGPVNSSSPNDFEFSNSQKMVSQQLIMYVREKNTVALAGLLDPLSVAWELTPWSFVIDWFIPVGNYLQARGLAQALTGLAVQSTFSRSVFAGLRAKPSNGSNFASQWTLTSGHDAIKSEYYSVSRSIGNGLSVPFPNVKSLMSVPSWKRAVNSVSLLDQVRPRRDSLGRLIG